MSDYIVNIAVGKSRKSTRWVNEEWTWAQLTKRLSKTVRTHETAAEYSKMNKNRQAEIKDVGGFIGGTVIGGRRKKGSILSRSLLTLDIDHIGASGDPWATFRVLFDCAACVYSTHKHKPTAKRLRLIVPLSREVSSEEYIAISRKVASEVGIDMFDDTTFQAHRLMYYPSTSSDAEFVFDKQDGEFLDADSVLNQYRDWRDHAEWAYSSRVDKIMHNAVSKQEDPTTKQGLIGAFCRTYDIHEAIAEFLKDEYESCDVENRYTYKKGSTSAGVVIYEDKFAYSHHETDPCGGTLCNAFDLLRIHKFRHLDEDTHAKTPINKRPSYVACLDFAAKDENVRKKLAAERLSSAKNDFADGYADPYDETAEVEDWAGSLDTDRKGNPYATINNILLILRNDKRLKGLFSHDEFADIDRVNRDTPWRVLPPQGAEMTDTDDMGLRHYIETNYSIASASKINDALGLILNENSRHPIREYLDDLEWDGVKRIDRLLIDFFNAEDCDYTKAVTRKTLVAAVARVYNPGCKFDYVLTLTGKEGLKKSRFLSKLGRDWFSDSFSSKTMIGREAYEQLRGAWILEMAELSSIKRADVENVKHFITKQTDRYRPAYGKRLVEYKRQCVFIATTNENDFLQSSTGNRRFWPVEVFKGDKDIDEISNGEINQIWAEAKHLYEKGEPLWLEDLEDEARERQERHTQKDERQSDIAQFLEMPLPDRWDKMTLYERRNYLNENEGMRAKGTNQRMQVCAKEIWAELWGKDLADFGRRQSWEVKSMLDGIPGWERKKTATKGVYGLQRRYVRMKNIKGGCNGCNGL